MFLSLAGLRDVASNKRKIGKDRRDEMATAGKGEKWGLRVAVSASFNQTTCPSAETARLS